MSNAQKRSAVETAPNVEVAGLDQIIDREALNSICVSFFELFGISIRVFSKNGQLVADVHQEQAICRYVNGFPKGKLGCAGIVNDVRAVDPKGESVLQACFTGATYRIVPIEYQGQRVGRFVLGPYLPKEVQAPPKSLTVIDARMNTQQATQLWGQMPHMGIETADRISRHFQAVLDQILFAGHRAQLTTEMHIASIRESYRELVEKTAQLQKAFDRLKELDQLKSAFLATVSHELRTPLTSILGYSEMILTGLAGDINEEQREFLTTIRDKGQLLLALIANMLDTSKLEQSRIELKRELVDPAAILKEISTTVGPIAQKRNLKINVGLQGKPPVFSADPVRVKQVVQNLVDNAMKFTPTGGEVTIGARVVSRAGEVKDGLGIVVMAAPVRMVEFVIRDTGRGIPAKDQERIFDAFFQVDGSNTREHGGAGLGLSIVKRLVDAHEGEIRLESQEGKGTTFFVDFPEQPSLQST